MSVHRNIALIASDFHGHRVQRMVEEAHRVAGENALSVIDEVWVPGSMEKPLAVKRMLMRSDIDAAVVLGIIEKGETHHGLVMAHAVMNALLALQLELLKPVGVGILGPEILPQQMDVRIIPYSSAAVLAVRRMLNDDRVGAVSR